MAYMNQEKKAEIAVRIKPLLKKYGLKGSLRVRHHSTIVLTITSGRIDFIESASRIAKAERERTGIGCEVGSYVQVNPYHADRQFDGQAAEFLMEAIDALNLRGSEDANFDKSDIMTDYFNVGWYVDINIGRWDKPYVLTAPAAVEV